MNVSVAVLCFVFVPKVLFQRKGLEDGVQFGESIMRDSHKRASVREFSRRESSRFSLNIRNDSSGGVSGESMRESMRESTKESEIERQDSFIFRLQGGESSKQGKWLPRANDSSVKSIVEETEDDLVAEDSTSTQSEEKMDKPQPRSSFSGLNRSRSSGLVPSSVASDFSISDRTSQDFQQMITEQEKMMAMAKKMMAEHKQMMDDTAEMMAKHTELKEQLKQANTEITKLAIPVIEEVDPLPNHAETPATTAEKPAEPSTGKHISASTAHTAMTEGSDSIQENSIGTDGSGKEDV